jgi:hypothetical protein
MTRASRDDELFDEGRLRRALRLEPGELPARLDAAAIAARAGGSRPRFASVVSAAVAATSAAALAVVAAVTVSQLAPAVINDALAALIERVTAALIVVEVAARTFQEPTLPMTALAALAVAIVYEYAQRRERPSAAHTS